MGDADAMGHGHPPRFRLPESPLLTRPSSPSRQTQTPFAAQTVDRETEPDRGQDNERRRLDGCVAGFGNRRTLCHSC